MKMQNLKLVNQTYQPPVEGKITIMAISPWVDSIIVNGNVVAIYPTFSISTKPTTEEDKKIKLFEQELQSLKNCGFNTIQITSPNTNLCERAIKNAKDLGLQAIWAYNNSITEATNAYTQINRLKLYNNLKGIQVKDEPTYAELNWANLNSETQATTKDIRKRFEEIRSRYPGLMSYFNLAYVQINTKETGEKIEENKIIGPFATYSQYLNYIQDNFAPPLWSYDVYPIITDSKGTYVDYKKFYDALNYFKSISDYTNRPFWAYCLCTEYYTSKYSRPLPTVGQLRFEAFNALAYGAQAIVYWHYGLRLPVNGENYVSAPIKVEQDSNNNYNLILTDIWYNVKQVNSEINKYSYIFYNGLVSDTVDGQNATLWKGPIQYIEAEGEGIVVSFIENNGNNYIIIVNKNPFETQKIKVTYQKDFTSKFETFAITSNIGLSSTFPTPAVTNKQDVKLDEGGYAILQWKAK